MPANPGTIPVISLRKGDYLQFQALTEWGEMSKIKLPQLLK